MQKFQDLLTEAAQLKQQQLKQQRKNFQALPEYLKSGLNYAKKYVQLRKQHYLVQKYISEKLKKQGNDQYLLENYGQALNKYQQALSVFRFIHATKYENLKDEDIIYENYQPQIECKEEHNNHLVALYLNICSALTKMNKKDEAIHSSEQALKLNDKNPKIYYKKAQAYLQYINRQPSDIKVGFYYLNKAYEESKDQSILTQMHKIKKELDEQRQKEKKWFKFMFDKNKEAKGQAKTQTSETKQNSKSIQHNPESKEMKPPSKQRQERGNISLKRNLLDSNVRDYFEEVKANHSPENQPEISEDRKEKQSLKDQQNVKNIRIKEQFQRFREENQNQQERHVSEAEKLQKTKITLKPYLIIPRDDRWLIKYQQDFIHKHGSKVYSILQLYNYSDYLIEFKSLLAKCLELKQAKITAERDENRLLDQKINMYQKFIDWVKKHPIEKYKKYIERYELQTKWIEKNRGKPLDEVYAKQPVPQKKKKIIYNDSREERINEFMESVRQTQNKSENTMPAKNKEKMKPQDINKKQSKSQFIEQMIEKEDQIKKKNEVKTSVGKKNEKNKINTHGFKQQWQCDEQDQDGKSGDEVPPHLKGFLQNYEDFPMYQQKLGQMKKEKKSQKKQNYSNQKQPISKNMQEDLQNIKQNPFGFVKTFLIVIAITLLGKLIF